MICAASLFVGELWDVGSQVVGGLFKKELYMRWLLQLSPGVWHDSDGMFGRVRKVIWEIPNGS